MARLLIDDEWYEAIDGRSWYERDFESVVEAHAHALFPSCHVIPFKIAVESEHGRKVPDLALVDTAYREWSVVEIEMAHHSLRGHVIPQVEVFAQGAYGEEHVQHLTGRLGCIGKTLRMVYSFWNGTIRLWSGLILISLC